MKADGERVNEIVCTMCNSQIKTINNECYYYCMPCNYYMCMTCAKKLETPEQALKRLEELGELVVTQALNDHTNDIKQCNEYFQGEMKSLLAAFASIDDVDNGQDKVEGLAKKLLFKLLDSVTSINIMAA